MRKTDAGSPERSFGQPASLVRMLRLGTVALTVAFVALSGAARAEDDEDEDTFEEKVIKQIMTGIGGTNMENTGIDYRERSPLVLPPRTNLRPPSEANASVNAPNWPKDVDAEQRRAAAKARRDADKDPRAAARVLSPSELSRKSKSSSAPSVGDSAAPGNPGATAILSPSQLGFEGGIKGLFGGSKEERAEFKSEPTRDSLTMPPPGYQTPSPNYAYGTGPKESLNQKVYNPSQGKYGD